MTARIPWCAALLRARNPWCAALVAARIPIALEVGGGRRRLAVLRAMRIGYGAGAVFFAAVDRGDGVVEWALIAHDLVALRVSVRASGPVALLAARRPSYWPMGRFGAGSHLPLIRLSFDLDSNPILLLLYYGLYDWPQDR